MLERLAKVIQHKTIDNEIHQSVEMHAKFKKKLGLTIKRTQMQKLTTENQRMLRRIQEVPPAYNHREWEEDARRNEHIKRLMALYPEYYEREEKQKQLQKFVQKNDSPFMVSSSSGSPTTFPKIK